MSLYRDLLDWLNRLALLEEEGEDLARRLEDLERQNALLQQRLVEGDGSGFEALTSLYEEGYHICPASFGESRSEDCLFCLNFLLHKGKRE